MHDYCWSLKLKKKTLVIRAQKNLPGQTICKWQLRIIPATDASGWHLLETGHLCGGQWTLQFPGKQLHVHRQLTRVEMPSEQATGRLGCFTQHGQLFDFRDWFAVSQGQQVTGLMSLRSGQWTYLQQTADYLAGKPDAVTLTLPCLKNRRYRRSFMLACTTLENLKRNDHLGLEYFEQDPIQGHTRWAPRLIAKHGFANPQRLKNMERITRTVC